MKKDTRESGRTTGYFRYALAAFTALLVLSLGFALIPRPIPEPAAPPFTEQARASALAETLRLRIASQQLAEGSSGARRQAFSRTVTLLTIQARALLLPSDDLSRTAAGPEDAASGSAQASGGASPATAATAVPATAQALVGGLSASGKLRLAHAQTADGGMARLLSSVGTAQLLQAAALAQASGVPAPAVPSAADLRAVPAVPSAASLAEVPAVPSAPAPAPAASCRAAASDGGTNTAPSSSVAHAATPPSPRWGAESTQSAGEATTADALAQVIRTELETVYGYQVALTRLEGLAVQQAKDLLAMHEAAVTEAETRSRLSCAPVPSREPGYTLDATFLNNPAAGLASLEAGTLPVYGDLVALSEGATRQWAIASLLTAAQRTLRWGSDPGPVPGLVLDTSQLPPLPETGAPSPSGTALPG